MEKVVNENGELVLKRTPWMQDVLTCNYAIMPLIAVMQGTIKGAFEQAISDHLQRCWKTGGYRDIIRELLTETGKANLLHQETFYKAAELIINSKILP